MEDDNIFDDEDIKPVIIEVELDPLAGACAENNGETAKQKKVEDNNSKSVATNVAEVKLVPVKKSKMADPKKSSEGDVSKTSEMELITITQKKVTRKKRILTIIPKPSAPGIPLVAPKVKVEIKKVVELDKHHENIITILLNSNATPIRRHESVGYKCCFCTKTFPVPKDLKAHSLSHDERTIKAFVKKNNNMSAYSIKLDITSLSCRYCDSNFELLDGLTQHLSSKHNKYFHEDIKSHIIPFKFNSDEFKCVICNTKCNFFKILLEHMNGHIRNHICETCGDGFVNKRMLQAHSYRHRKGEFKCSYCVKIFDTSIKKREHERGVHIALNKRYKCGYCEEKFTDYVKRQAHHIKVHSAKPFILECNACSKTFDNQRALTQHVKSYHFMGKGKK